MKILILDDMKIRHIVYREIYAGHDLIHVDTAAVAKMALDQHRFDLAHLDHDLSPSHYTAYGNGADPMGGTKEQYEVGTGMDVVDFICGQAEQDRPKRVIVHSWNEERAPEMVQRLCRHGIDATWEKFDPDKVQCNTDA
jgi:hypothetical protein